MWKEHIQHVQQMLLLLWKHQLYVKHKKCAFGQQQIDYLGHIVSHNRITMQESKVHIICNWKPLKTVKDVQHFLGFTRFYCKFIQGYVKIAGPLHDLLHKDCIFEWGSRQHNAFEELKQVITTAPVLQLPRP